MDTSVNSDTHTIPRQQPSESLAEPIIVFQCQTCKVILGDSSNWVSSNNTLKTVTLEQVTDKIRIVDKLKTSSTCGSAYLPLFCTDCSEGIGRMYKTTTSTNDIMRDRFSLFASKITSYEIGSGSVQHGANVDEANMPLVSKINGQIEKMHSVIVSMNARLFAIEEYIADPPN